MLFEEERVNKMSPLDVAVSEKGENFLREIAVIIAGKAGDGVLFTGNMLAKILKRHGFEVITYRDFPSNIRGESTSYSIRASSRKIYGLGDEINLLLAFDCQAVLAHLESLDRGIVLCDGEGLSNVPAQLAGEKTFYRFLLRKLAKERFGNEIYKNMISLGALSFILHLDTSLLEELITETFLARKGKEVVEKNIEAIFLGYEKAGETLKETERHPLEKKEDRERLILIGDEAIALGALAAGCRFFAAYPICPASEIWQWLAIHLPNFNGVVVQTEDELAALNMAIGAAYGGARAMTATSGPGASLMMEAFSLAGMAEIPIVIAHVQRLGPATGMPTKSQQGDLLQWIFGSHGEFPKIVLSPGSVEECFEFTVKAFNLAEKFQCPVVLLTEEDMGQNLQTARKFDLGKVSIDRGKLLSQEALTEFTGFKRYALTSDGISPRAIPGMKGGLHMVEGNEHNEKGYRDEDPENRIRMMEKRMRKLAAASKEVIPPKLWGNPAAKVGIFGCGSTFGPILEAMEQLEEEGVAAKFLQLRTLWPFPSEEVRVFLSACEEAFVVENNYSAQLRQLIKSQIDCALPMRSILKYSTQNFRPREISEFIEKTLR